MEVQLDIRSGGRVIEERITTMIMQVEMKKCVILSILYLITYISDTLQIEFVTLMYKGLRIWPDARLLDAASITAARSDENVYNKLFRDTTPNVQSNKSGSVVLKVKIRFVLL